MKETWSQGTGYGTKEDVHTGADDSPAALERIGQWRRARRQHWLAKGAGDHTEQSYFRWRKQ